MGWVFSTMDIEPRAIAEQPFMRSHSRYPAQGGSHYRLY